MVQKEVITNVPISELKPILEKHIKNIKGNLIFKNRNSLKWNLIYRKNEIEVVTILKKIDDEVLIKLSSKNIDKKTLGEGVAITEFLNSLSQEIELTEVKDTTKKTKTKKPRVKPTSKTQTNNANFKPYYIVLVVVFLIYFFSRNTNDNSTLTRITNQGFKASYNKESLERFVRYSVDQDYDAMNHLIYNGEVFELPAGQEVYIVKSEFPGKVKIRLKGDTNEIWTFTEAIKE
ncbi:hypothetical protein NHF50_10540 [Flavobacterium sp. NRK F10]|uniref:hypothetical protein n=1 Tax=Flavobacterium sp. NRK F10 TaxID=2954931 RepID=UPI002091A997|nr:hypothetical protein [Flavobacterium sp. NRK F10]MCO6175481.1 hypothetical protein [Flavobacterium sp. NRK F10]